MDLTPLFGGALGDRLLGRHRAVVLGGVLRAIGHVVMACKGVFLAAQMWLILGNGCFKLNVSGQVGLLDRFCELRRNHAFSVFYRSVLLGALMAPLMGGTLGQVIDLLNQRWLPVEALHTTSAAKPPAALGGSVLVVPLCIVSLMRAPPPGPQCRAAGSRSA